MRSSLTIHIPEPCHEDWKQMSPAAAGRHCAACQKTVVDFSLMTDGEILAYLAKRSGNLCGRFADSQLARPLQPLGLWPAPRWRSWLAATLAVWMLREAPALAASAKPPTRLTPPKPAPRRHLRSTGGTRPIRGVVRDNFTGNGVPDAAVFLQGENHWAMTDSSGGFTLYPGFSPQHTLVVHRADYLSRKQKLLPGVSPGSSVTIWLAPDTAAEVKVTAQMVPREIRQLGGFRVVMSPTSAELISPFKLIPEPVRRFSTSLWQKLTQPFRRH